MSDYRPKHYILVGRTPIAVDLMTWARWFEDHDARVVKQDQIGPMFVSTIFLGLDHNFLGRGDPILFETMLFDGDMDGESMWRYCTYKQAEDGHARVVAQAKRILETTGKIATDALKAVLEEHKAK